MSPSRFKNSFAGTLTNKYYDGRVPAGEIDWEITNQSLEFINRSKAYIEQFKFRDGLSEAMGLARFGNKFLADLEPWKLQKTNPEEVKKIMFSALLITGYVAEAIDPFLPDSAQKIREMLKINAGFEGFAEGHEIAKAVLLFTKVEDVERGKQIEKLQKVTESKTEAKELRPFKENISFDEFMKMDIRVGTVLSAEKVAKADKLLQLSVDLGSETRTIISGIAQHFSPEDVVGKQVSVLCNLEPRKIRGVESQGMILMAEDDEGNLMFISPSDRIDSGAEIR